LSHFISRLREKSLPLYQLLKKHECFSWTVKAQEALDKLKTTLTHAPILMPPQYGEPLYLLRRSDHPGGQRSHRRGANKGRPFPASPKAGVLY
jgi:hypothetical protein